MRAITRPFGVLVILGGFFIAFGVSPTDLASRTPEPSIVPRIAVA
jgi:hypothetical protein